MVTTARAATENAEAAKFLALADTVAVVDATTWAGLELVPLYPGCTTTSRLLRDGQPLADVTGERLPYATFLTESSSGRGYHFPTRRDALAAALCNEARGYWYGEV